MVPSDDLAPRQLGYEDQLKVYTKEVDYDRRKIVLSFIDTPGYGDHQDNNGVIKLVSDYVEKQFKAFLKEESRIQRNAQFLDTRVHCILYFVNPNGHWYVL